MLPVLGGYAFLLQVPVDAVESPPLLNWILQRFGLSADNLSRAGDGASDLGINFRPLGSDKKDDIVVTLLCPSN